MLCRSLCVFFWFHDRAPTEIYTHGHTPSLHDALPISLIRLVCGLERMDRGAAGRIALFGQETQADGRFSAQAEARRGDVGVIFQQFNLVNRLSLLTNVLAGRLGRVARWRGTLGLFPHADRVAALRALERVGLIDQTHQRASTLSGGQQQRGAIARVLTQQARLILADEPIASLDPASARLVMSMLREINRQDRTTVIVRSEEHTSELQSL